MLFQPRKFPDEPELISIGSNVMVSSEVTFVTHDTFHYLFHNMGHEVNAFRGCIEIGDNVAIGSKVIILPNIRIGSNVVIGAGAIITKDIPDNSVVVGASKIIGSFDDLLERRKLIGACESSDEMWARFRGK